MQTSSLLVVALVVSVAVAASPRRSLHDALHHTNNNKLGATPTSNYGNLTLVATGYTWIENIFFDPTHDAMFFADSYRGEVIRVTKSSSGGFQQETWLSGFKRCLGFARNPDHVDEMYGVAWLDGAPFGIIAFSTTTPQQWRTVATTNEAGNGLGFDLATNTLYTASEGDFLADKGVVYSVDMTGVTNTSQGVPLLFDYGLEAADGLWIDEATRILYVSEVLNATVRRYDLTKASLGGRGAFIGQYQAPGMQMLDDFSVTASYCASQTPTLFGADFWAGSVYAFAADGSSSSTVELVSGLFNPTSVRPGVGAGFTNGKTLYISEGGGIEDSTTDRRLWQLTLDDRFAC